MPAASSSPPARSSGGRNNRCCARNWISAHPPGNFTYTVQLGKLPGETNLDNNRKTFSLTVHAKALKVLYVDGVLRWEGKFIREALTSDPDINVISSVRTAPPGTDRGSQGLLLPEALAKVDMVILGDVEATYLPAQEMDALRTWVTTKGSALLLTGGYNSFGPKGFGGSQLREILPVRFSAGKSACRSAVPPDLDRAGRGEPDLRSDRQSPA